MLAMECRLEEAVLEDLLCKLPEIRVYVRHSDQIPMVGFLPGPDVSLPASHGVNVTVDCPTDPSLALECASAPEGAEVGCSPAASMEVLVGSPLLHDDDTTGALAELLASPMQDEAVEVEDAVLSKSHTDATLVGEPAADVEIQWVLRFRWGFRIACTCSCCLDDFWKRYCFWGDPFNIDLTPSRLPRQLTGFFFVTMLVPFLFYLGV